MKTKSQINQRITELILESTDQQISLERIKNDEAAQLAYLLISAEIRSLDAQVRVLMWIVEDDH